MVGEDMTTFTHVTEVLKQMSPLEILEMCGLDEAPEALVDALSDNIEDNVELVRSNLIDNNIIGELDEEV